MDRWVAECDAEKCPGLRTERTNAINPLWTDAR
jgi:hypothetical protein